VATAADRAARPVPNRTTVIGSGIVTGPPGLGVTVAMGVAVTVAVIASKVDVGVGVTIGVEVNVGVITVVGSVVGVSAAGGSCANTTAGTAANDRSIISNNATRMLTCAKLDRFIDRPLLMMTDVRFRTQSKSRSSSIEQCQTISENDAS
jgi:hypothetical protein